MYFPNEVMKYILSFLPHPYRKPPHLDAFKEIPAYCALQDLMQDPDYQESIDTPDMYMHSSLYRFTMDDYSFRRRDCGLETKWNPFMALYCSRAMSAFETSIVDPGYGDSQRKHNRFWSPEHGRRHEIIRDFCAIQDHLRDVESLAWWFD